MPKEAIIEIFCGKDKPSQFITVTPDLYTIGYRYDRRNEVFILAWRPELSARVQEISVLPRFFARVLPELKASILRGYVSGCVDVTDIQLRDLGFIVKEVYARYVPA